MESNPQPRNYVLKRDGTKQDVFFDKVTQRIDKLMDIEPRLNREKVNIIAIAQKVIVGIFPGIKTSELDNLAAETAAYMSVAHYDYSMLGGRIAMSNLHKQTPDKFSDAMEYLYTYRDSKSLRQRELLSEEFIQAVRKNKDILDNAIVQNKDYTYDFFAFKTLEHSYLLSIEEKPVETPQYMLMRVAVGIHYENIDDVLETYNLLSEKFFTHATPTLFNAGSPRPQMSSCFILDIKDDSLEGIYDTLKDCAMLSKNAGGIGLSVSKIRASKSYIHGTNGHSNGLVPMLANFDATARYVDQGGGKRKGSFAIYLEPWHADIYDFLELKKSYGKEELRCRTLFYGLWICDLFMQRVDSDGDWSLFCPTIAVGLADTYGDEFESLYLKYENIAGYARKVVKARHLWQKIIDAQVESGVPYMLYKDAANKKSNQKNVGMVKSSNLCTEIMEVTTPDRIAVCNLDSISLPRFLDENGQVNHHLLQHVVKVCTKNANKIIDRNYYPLEETKASNLETRPIGNGVQGYADLLLKMGLPFDSERAKEVNMEVFETIYYAACLASMELAKLEGPYPKFKGSPASEGILQFDLWGVKPSSRWNWDGLKEEIKKHGLRNSLLIALMPTASTSQILGNNECFEPYSSNIYTRRVLSGDFPVVNKHLVEALDSRGLWTQEIRDKIVSDNGSVQKIEEIPKDLKELFRTAWEISMKAQIDIVADRAPFVDQSQSMSAFVSNPSYQTLTSMHFYTWKKGLKTGMYYLRTPAHSDAAKVTIEPQKKRKSNIEESNELPPKNLSCAKQEDGCITCSS